MFDDDITTAANIVKTIASIKKNASSVRWYYHMNSNLVSIATV